MKVIKTAIQTNRFLCLLITVILAGVCNPLGAADDDRAKECLALLNSVGSNSHESPLRRWEALTRIDALRLELKKSSLPNVVIYAFVAASTGVSIIRYEQLHGSEVSEEIVTQTSTTPGDFRRMTSAARQPDSYFNRRLKTDFSFLQGERDKGKQVFLMDTDAFGLIPNSFDLPDTTLFASPSLRTAIANLSNLGAQSPFSTRYAALFAIPNTPYEYRAIFGDSTGASRKYPPLEKWQPHYRRQEDMVRDHQLTVLSPTGTSHAERKSELLRHLEDQDGIVMIVAHADGAEIRIASHETIKITPDDIAALHFRKSPFVFLRVCQGKDEGFADAFLRAGASGVWANRGLMDAGIANEQADAFLTRIRAGNSILDSIKAVDAANPDAAHSNVLFTVTRSRQNSRSS